MRGLMAGERCAGSSSPSSGQGGRSATIADSLGTLVCFKSPRVTSVPACHPCARHEAHRAPSGGLEAGIRARSSRASPPEGCSPPAGRVTVSSLFPFGSWVSFRVYIYFRSVEAPVTQRVFSEGKTNPNEIPEQSSPRSRAACFWK